MNKHYLFLRRYSCNDLSGGIERRILDWFKYIDYSKYKISLAMIENRNNVFSRDIISNHLHVNVVYRKYDYRHNFLIKFLNMIALFREVKPSHVVFVQGSFTDFNLPDVLAGFLYTRGNVFMTEHTGAPAHPSKKRNKYFKVIPGIGFWWHRRKVGYLLRAYLVKRIYAASNEVKDRIVKLYKYPEKKVISKYHGVDVGLFTPDIDTRIEMRAKMNIPDDHKVIVSTARLSPEKSLHRLINAFEIVSKKFKNCWLVMVGDGPLMDELRSLAANKEANSRIKFFGFQNSVVRYLQMSDIFVLPSDNEGFGIASLEAMSTGLISVCTKTPGPSEIIQNCITGFLNK